MGFLLISFIFKITLLDILIDVREVPYFPALVALPHGANSYSGKRFKEKKRN